MVHTHLDMLGKKVTDKITGLTGIATSICFDLYGCIQLCINPGLDKEGKQRDQHWYDVSRITVIDKKPVMQRPDFVAGPVAAGNKGAAEKPSMKAN